MKPILFNIEMVRAILEGRKTVTRRVIKGARSKFHLFHFLGLETDPDICSINKWGDEVPKTVKGLYAEFEADDSYPIDFPMFKSPYQVGDILYVREAWAKDCFGNYVYKADYVGTTISPEWKWKPSIHMPKESARIWLKVTDVRVERLQDITEEDAIKEGCKGIPCEHHGYTVGGGMCGCTDCMNTGWLEPPTLEFMDIWNSTIKKQDLDRYGWDENPWVWVFEFERIEKEGEEK